MATACGGFVCFASLLQTYNNPQLTRSRLFVQDDTDSVTSLDYPDSAIGTPAPTPTQSWTQKSHPYQTRQTFDDLYLDSILLLPKFQTLTLTEVCLNISIVQLVDTLYNILSL
jgi:hypothetical protein